MVEDKNAPEIRFDGFSNEWETRKLGEIVEIIDGDRGINYPNGDDFQEHGHTLFLSAANITKNGFSFESNQYITKAKSESLGNGKLQLNDVVLTSRGSLGHVAWYSEKIWQQVQYLRINSGMLLLRSSESTIPCFVEQFLNSPMGRKQIELISFGSAQPQLTKKDVINYDISFTDTNEQAAIGNFFRTLDDAITLKKQQHEKTANIKKAMLEKMFPKNGADVPEIRFEGFKGAWEHKQLSSISDTTYGGGTPSTAKEDYWNGNIPWIQSADVREHNVMSICIRKKITVKGLGNSAAKLIPANSIAIVTRVGVGKLCAIPFEYSTSQDMLSLSRLNVDVIFAVYAIYTKFQSELNAVQGTSIKGVTKDELLRKSIKVPVSSDEQTAIGNFFRNLDTLIEAQREEIEKLQNIKKACLDKMFV